MSFNDDSANARRFHGRREPWENDVRWPNGASLALSFVLNIEEGAELSVADGDEANESVHAVTHRIDGHPDYCLATHFEYGARSGYCALLARRGAVLMTVTMLQQAALGRRGLTQKIPSRQPRRCPPAKRQTTRGPFPCLPARPSASDHCCRPNAQYGTCGP